MRIRKSARLATFFLNFGGIPIGILRVADHARLLCAWDDRNRVLELYGTRALESVFLDSSIVPGLNGNVP